MTKTTSVKYLILSILGIIFGLSGCVAFAFLIFNLNGSIWAFISAVFAAINFKLHLLHIKDKLDEWHSIETLSGLKFLGLATFLISFGCSAWYIFYVVYKDLSIFPVKDSMVIPIVWSLMTAKWGGLLIAAAERYIKVLESPEPPLISQT